MVELFAGVGGFRVGLEKYFQTIFFNQYEPGSKEQHAFKVYLSHFPEHNSYSNMDISEVVSHHLSEIPETFELLVGGFPCQDYSVAKPLGRSKGIEGKKGVLWWDIYKIVKKRLPKYVFLENVDRLLKSPTSQRGRDFAIMLKTLGSLGYLVEWRVINSGEQGFPQRRIRVYIVAKKKSSFKDMPKAEASVSFLKNGGLLAKSYPASKISNFSKFRISGSPSEISDSFPSSSTSPFQNSGYYLNGRVYTAKVEFKKPNRNENLVDILETDMTKISSEYWLTDEDKVRWEIAKGPTKKPRKDRETGYEFTYSEGKMPFPDKTDRPSRTIVTGEGGSSPSRFKHIIEQDGKLRRLIPSELDKLSGFPADWTQKDFSGKIVSDSKRAFFIGNALVVGVVRRIGKIIAEDHSQG